MSYKILFFIFGLISIKANSQWTGAATGYTGIHYSGGNVGIGTSAPTSKLHLQGSSNENTFLTIQRSNNANSVITVYSPFGNFSDINPGWMVGMREGGRAGFSVSTWNGAAAYDRLNIHPNGNIGMGTDNAAGKLHIYQATADHAYSILERSNNSYQVFSVFKPAGVNSTSNPNWLLGMKQSSSSFSI